MQEVKRMLHNRNLKLINIQKGIEKITHNKIIMMHATEYIENNRIKKQCFDEIIYI